MKAIFENRNEPILLTWSNGAKSEEYILKLYCGLKSLRFFPKKTDLTFITHQQVRQVEQKLSNRPVRKFNYQTPNQMLQRKIALIT